MDLSWLPGGDWWSPCWLRTSRTGRAVQATFVRRYTVWCVSAGRCVLSGKATMALWSFLMTDVTTRIALYYAVLLFTRPTRIHFSYVTTLGFCYWNPLNGPVLFCSLASVVCRHRLSSSVTLPASGRAGHGARGRSGGRHCTAGQYDYVPCSDGRPTARRLRYRRRQTTTDTNDLY